MRAASRLLFSAVILTTFAASAFPQKRLCPKPPPSPFKHDGEIVTIFDSRAGGMRTTLQHPRPLGGGANLFYMAASFMHQNASRPGTPSLDLVIYAAAPGAQLAGQRLALLLDGRPLALATRASYRSQPGAGDAVRLTLSYAEASALTHARRVEARLGGAGVELTSNHLEALREMLSIMAPSPGRWQTANALAR